MKSVYQHIKACMEAGKKCLAVLIDPDKTSAAAIPDFLKLINNSAVTHVFVGGSHVPDASTSNLVRVIKQSTDLPVILFPGEVSQITTDADALLYLSLISGRNADFLIGKHVESVSLLRDAKLEIIPTGYILIQNGKPTSVERISETQPMDRADIQKVVDTALAGQLLGLKMVYLEAGSGALHPVGPRMISAVKKALNVPLIVGGGIRGKDQAREAFDAGADVVVIGTVLEESPSAIYEFE